MKVEVDTLPGCTTVIGERIVKQNGIVILTVKHAFINWCEVIPGVLYRSSAPYYYGNWEAEMGQEPDHSQHVDYRIAGELTNRGIKTVISLNHFPLPPLGKNYLLTRQIDYIHLPVPDFGVPNLFDLVRVACASRGKSTLVWCGYGQGRTGLMVSAIEIISGKKSPRTAINDSTAEEDVQEELLWKLPDNRRLFELCREVARSLREYDGSGKAAKFFRMRKKSVGSIAMHQFLSSMFLTKFGLDYRDENQVVNEKENICFRFSEKCPQMRLPWLQNQQRPEQFSLTYDSFLQFIDFYTGRANKCDYYGLLAEYRVLNPTEPKPGDTLKNLLLGAIARYDGLGITD